MSTAQLNTTLSLLDNNIVTLERTLRTFLGCRAMSQVLQGQLVQARHERYSVLLERDGGR